MAHNYSRGLLYNDSTMFLYIAWCVRHGARLYEAVGMPDGPFVCVLHLVMQLVTGTSEPAFRRLDLTIHAVLSGAVGMLLVPRQAQRLWLSRFVWAIVSASIWLASVFHWAFAESVQRESYYALLGVLGFALWFASGEAKRRVSAIELFVGGICLALPVFGKQTTVFYAVLAYVGIALEASNDVRSRRSRMALAGAGLAAGAGLMLAFVALFGSLRGYLFWNFEYITTFYRFVDRKPLLDVVKDMPKDLVPPAVVCLVAGVVAIGRGLLPVRALPFAAAPALALVGAVLQRQRMGLSLLASDGDNRRLPDFTPRSRVEFRDHGYRGARVDGPHCRHYRACGLAVARHSPAQPPG